jgi:FtsH-binding integral membrane protein
MSALCQMLLITEWAAKGPALLLSLITIFIFYYMKQRKNIKRQIVMAFGMFLISTFMAVSYYVKISNNEAGKLTTIAFYFWTFLVVALLIKVIYDFRRVKQLTGKK